jgi:hypothetical protein
VSAPPLIYGLCLIASAGCAILLWRAYQRSRMRLLFWTAISFCFFALNNLALVIDIAPSVDLWALRQAAIAAGLATLIYGFVWETR